jgi:hypothetical protein
MANVADIQGMTQKIRKVLGKIWILASTSEAGEGGAEAEEVDQPMVDETGMGDRRFWRMGPMQRR